MNLNKKFLNKIRKTDKPITSYGNKVNYIDRWLYISKKDFSKEYEIIPNLNEKEIDSEWSYYSTSNPLETNIIEKEIKIVDDTLIYCLANIYSKRKQKTYMYFNSYLPLKVWINGRIVFKGSFNNHYFDYSFIVDLEQGDNTILVEKMSFYNRKRFPIWMKYFTVVIKPYELIKFEYDSKILPKHYFTEILEGVELFLNSPIISGDTVNIFVLPKYVSKDIEPLHLKIESPDGSKEIVSVRTHENIEIKLNLKGILRLVLMKNGNAMGETYIFIGCIEELEGMLSINQDFLFNYFNIKTNSLKVGLELIDNILMKGILKTLYSKNHSFFPYKYTENEKENEGIYFLTNINGKKKKLIVYITYGLGESKISKLDISELSMHFEDTLFLCIAARGKTDLNKQDFILGIIDDVQSRYGINDSTVHVIGVCTGAWRGMNLAISNPSRFSSITNIIGISRLDKMDLDRFDLQNLKQLKIIQLSNIEDFDYNYPYVRNFLEINNNHEIFEFGDFSHVEFSSMMINRYLIEYILIN